MMQVEASKGNRRPKMAIVSTYDELCGIAAYTKYLVPQLDDDFNVHVFELDQYLLRSSNNKVQYLGDEHIKQIASSLKDFDVVNIQLEHGTLGRSAYHIGRRFKWLVQAAPRLSVTFHTMTGLEGFDIDRWLAEVFSFHWVQSTDRMLSWRRDKQLTRMTAGLLAVEQHKKQISVIVHNRRDMKHMKYVHGIKDVFDHPLSFLDPDMAANIRLNSSRTQFPATSNLPVGAVLVGVFGFLGKYKGFDTAIQALQWLPNNYHLLIFGGVHPNEIKRNETISPAVNALIETISNIANNQRERELKKKGDSSKINKVNEGAVANDDELSANELIPEFEDILKRVHFMGALSDIDFIRAMAVSDVVVMPYLEVGQSSSGPISQALELGCRVIASRTKAFMQLDRYQPGALEFFDIGNHIELATRISSISIASKARYELPLSVVSNRETYIKANSIV